MVAIATFVLAALSSAVAQQPPPPGPAQPPAQSMPIAAPMQQQPLQNGPCLDSLRAVPKVLQAPVSRGMQIVRIDQVLSTATMTPNEIIGFLYTLQDGSTWLGQRTKDYQSAADATAINRVLSATHVPGYTVDRVSADHGLRRSDETSAALPRPDPTERPRPAASRGRPMRDLAV